MKKVIGVAVLLLALASSVQAAAVAVSNGSFEDSFTGTTWNWNDQDDTGVKVISSWNYDYAAAGWPSPYDTGTWDGNGGAVPAYEGLRMAYVRGGAETGPWQDLGVAIEAGQIYSFSMAIQRRQSSVASALTLNYHDSGIRTAIAVNNIDLTTIARDAWGVFTVSFTAQAGDAYIGKSLGIEFNNTDSDGTWNHYDMATVDVIPEPASLLLLSIGGLLLKRRSR